MTDCKEIRADSLGTESGRALRDTLIYPLKVHRYRYMVANFFRREFFGRFKGSMLGVGWVMIEPVTLFLIYFFVFGLLFNMRAMDGMPGDWYPFYLFSGVVSWLLFANSTSMGLGTAVENGNLIKKVAFPAELLPFSVVLVNLIVMGVGVGILGISAGGWMLVSPETAPIQTWPGLKLLLLIPLALEIALFSLGFTLLLATIFVFLRDISQIWNVFTLFWFFATPIFWHEGMLGESPAYQALKPLMEINPYYHFVQGFRACLGLYDYPLALQELGVESAVQLAARACLFGILPSLVVFVVGCFCFNLFKKRFADEV